MDPQQTGDGGGKEYQRVADELRNRMADGTYPLQSFLPAQRELAEKFEVSRDTVRRALQELTEEGWISTRQGSGSRVVEVQRSQSPTSGAKRSRLRVSPGPAIQAAFEKPEVALDVSTLSAQTLDTHIRLQAERIHSGEIAPDRISLRLLLPDEKLQLPYPRRMDDKTDTRLWERLHVITQRHTQSLSGVLNELQTIELVRSVDVQIRRAPLTPVFKLYLLNGEEVLHGMYEVIERQIELDDGEVVEALDVLGLGARLTHHVADRDPNSPGSVFVDNMRAWFESVWQRLAE